MRVLGMVTILMLTACKGEPTFDERFEKANEEIDARASAIDTEMEQATATKGSERPEGMHPRGPDSPEQPR